MGLCNTGTLEKWECVTQGHWKQGLLVTIASTANAAQTHRKRSANAPQTQRKRTANEATGEPVCGRFGLSSYLKTNIRTTEQRN